MKTIVVGYAGTEAAWRALERAADYAEALGGKLLVTSVMSVKGVAAGDALFSPAAGSVGDPLGVSAPPVGLATEPAEILDVEEEHDEVAAFLHKRGVAVEYVSALGSPADALIQVADERGADLIVVGSRGEPGFLERIVEGSVSRDVSVRAHCDVLIVH